MNEMYKRIEAKCRENGLTISEMCRKTGVMRSRMSDLKSGRVQTVNVKSIRAIADLFGVTPDWLQYGDDEQIIRVDPQSEYVNIEALVKILSKEQLLEAISLCTREIQRRDAREAERKVRREAWAEKETDGEK